MDPFDYTDDELDAPDFYPSRDAVEVRAAWEYIGSLHCTLWADFLVTTNKGRLTAARWLGGRVHSVNTQADKIRYRQLNAYSNEVKSTVAAGNGSEVT